MGPVAGIDDPGPAGINDAGYNSRLWTVCRGICKASRAGCMISDSWKRRAYSRDEREHEHEQEKRMMTHILFFLATILAGTLNALAGGGGLITFPLLMLVVPPVTADATSAVALFFAYPTAVWRTRSQLNGVFGRGWLWVLLVPCVLGGLMGALLLTRTGNRNFMQLVPWLALARGSRRYFPCRIVWWLFRRRNRHPDDRRIDVYFAGRHPARSCAQEPAEWLLARRGSHRAHLRGPRAMGLRRADGAGWFDRWIHRRNDIASRQPHSCSLFRYRDRFGRVRLLLLEIVRPRLNAHRRRIGRASEAASAAATRRPDHGFFPRTATIG